MPEADTDVGRARDDEQNDRRYYEDYDLSPHPPTLADESSEGDAQQNQEWESGLDGEGCQVIPA